MSHDSHQKAELQAHEHAPVNTITVEGHGGTHFEGTDAKVGIIVGSLIVIVGTLVISFLLVIPIHKLLRAANPPGELPSPIAPGRVVPEKPVLQVHPWNEYPEKLAAWNKQLSSYGKNVAGMPHIPIDQAISDTAGQVNVRSNSPEGFRIPGGQGRDFSLSLADMPPPYQTQQPPQSVATVAAKKPAIIQGEIRKNAPK